MVNIKDIPKQIIAKCIKGLNHISKNPMETVELILAFAMLIFAIYTGLPQELRPSSSNSAYANDTVRIIFASLLAYPAISIIYLRITKNIHDYVYTFTKQRRNALFWISVAWIYTGILRMVAVAFLPPIWVAYIAIGFISAICYLRLGK